jgi:hypothetical protein
VWGGHAAKTLAWHPGNLEAHQAVDVSSAWFRLPTGLPWVIRGVIVLILVVGPAALVLLRPVRRWLHPAHPSDAAMALLVALGAFVLAYLAALAVTQVVVDASTQPNQRLLAPVQMAAYLVLAAVVGLGGDRLAARHWGGVRAGAALVAVLAAAALVAPVLGLPRLARALHHSVTAERALAAHDPLRSLPSGLILFSDNPSGLWLHTGLASYRLPTPIEFTTGRQDPDYPTDFREAGAIVAQQGGLIVVSTPELAATYTAGGVLRLIGTCATGEVLVAAPGTEGAAAAAGAC